MIAASDLHLQLKPPRCRTESEDDWLEYQRKILRFIVNKANEKKDDLFIAGDIFDKAISSQVLIRMFIEEMNRLDGYCYIMAGNHDLPNHSHDEMSRSSYGVLDALGGDPSSKIRNMIDSECEFVPFGENKAIGNKVSDILFVHRFVVQSKDEVIPGMIATTARDLVSEYPDHALIICGDNHHKFKVNIKGTTVLNCGCITKRTIDFQDEILSIWRIDGNLNIEEIPIPDNSILVRDAVVEAKKESEDKFTELVELLKETGTMTLDYVANLRSKMHVLDAGAQKELEGVLSEI